MKAFKRIICILLALAAIIVVGGHFAINFYVDNALKPYVSRRMNQVVGPAESYDISVVALPWELARGYIRSLTISGSKVRLRDGSVVESVRADVHNVRVDLMAKSVSDVGGADFRVMVTGDELNRFMANKYPEIENLKVALDYDYITISGVQDFGGTRVEMKAKCTLLVRDGHKLMVKVKDISAQGLNLSSIGGKRIQKAINPLFDTRKWNFDVTLDYAEISPGGIALVGKADAGSALGLKRNKRD